MCRKVALAEDGGSIEVWGDGEQTRSFCYIDDCVEGLYRLMYSDYDQPLNLGTERMVSINELARIVMNIADKSLSFEHIEGPEGVRGRNFGQHAVARGSRLGAADRSRTGSRRDVPLDRKATERALSGLRRKLAREFIRARRCARRRYQRDRSRRCPRRDHTLDRRRRPALRVRHGRARRGSDDAGLFARSAAAEIGAVFDIVSAPLNAPIPAGFATGACEHGVVQRKRRLSARARHDPS